MKLLLIYPEQSTDLSPFHPPSVSKVTGTFPPLGLAYIAAAAKSKGHEVKIFDLQQSENNLKNLIDSIKKMNPDPGLVEKLRAEMEETGVLPLKLA